MMVWGLIVFVLLGAAMLAAGVYPAVWLAAGDFISGPLALFSESLLGHLVWAVAGLLCLCLPLYVVLGNLASRQKERTVVLQNPMGEVLVSLPAIEDFSRILKGRIPGLREIKGKVWYRRKKILVNARITVFSDVSIAPLTAQVQEQIRDYVRNTLSIDQEINPTVIVTKIVPRERAEAGSGAKNSGHSSVNRSTYNRF
jgi:hypothetical protein